MKSILLFLAFMSTVLFGAAQEPACLPDTTLPDSVLLFPLPALDTAPGSGFQREACLGRPYEQVITFTVPDQFPSPVGPIPLDFIALDTVTSIPDLPEGLDYACNPPDCLFEAETSGCLVIFGTPTDSADIGADTISISGIVSAGGTQFELSFPGEGTVPGIYAIDINAEGPACETSSVSNPLAETLELQNRPNPFYGFTQIRVNAQRGGAYRFQVHDLLGRLLHDEQVRLLEGENVLPFDGSRLAPGIYLYSLADGRYRVTRRMVVGKE